MNRIKSKLRLSLSLMATPLFSLLTFPSLSCFPGFLEGHLFQCVQGVVGFFIAGLVPVLLATMVLGLPVLYAALRLGIVRYWQCSLLGAAVGGLLATAVGLYDGTINLLGFVFIAASLGASAGLFLWFFGIRGNTVAR